ncbi:hypothetical protein [Streptomyces brasiliensis]|uniref:Lipoprotein n=1 Tax=Streptomyces brasiliensis TaxID=1954 RepID=A0A917KLJ3_9ACTN|nr:hypothetical protein [Streptomyces brasiliensis]GGJ17643.1 hypothetical protein GCM10010121_030610 [Streptomyces brasiliensis]
MGSLRLTLCTGILAAAALVPTAHAADGGGVQVTPSSAAPGGDIALRVSGCATRTATAVSDAFVSDAALSGTDGTLSGDGRIRSTATPGVYDVRITCGDTQVKSTVTVSGTGLTPDALSPLSPLSTPVAPVPAGGGGTAAHFASVDVRSEGPGATQGVVGLVLAGLAALAVGLLPRARRSCGKD